MTTSVVVIVVLQNFKLLSPIDHDLQHSIIVFNNKHYKCFQMF